MTGDTSPQFSFAKYLSRASAVLDIRRKKGNQDETDSFENKLKALGMVSTGIAHDLNGPLATIKACSDGLLNRLENNKLDLSLFKTYLEIIEEEIDRCVFITDNILRFVQHSKKECNNLVDVNSSLDKTISMLQLQGRCSKIEIVRKYENSTLMVSGIEYEFRQVFLSIIDNALDVMQEGDRLTLETRIDKESILIAINNTGIPIDREYLRNIFDPYFTTKAEAGGTGLGLFLASNIIKEWGGEISVISEERSGTTFTIILPTVIKSR